MTMLVHTHFTTRLGGVSQPPYDSLNLGAHVGDDPDAVWENRARVAAQLNLDPARFIWMDQVHSATVRVVDAADLGAPIPATDAVVTTDPTVVLTVMVADCVPVLLYDADAGVIAAAHAGRTGARNGVVSNTVAAMVELGAKPENITAHLGPAASGRRYELPREMAEDVEEQLPGSLTRTDHGTWGSDVRAGLARQLTTLGVGNIIMDPRCTIEDSNLFSYRRDGKTGRQTGIIWGE
jgi:conserved hypothetical protein, YfiH family